MRALWVVALASSLAACSNFPVIDSGVCGNRVVDDNEDCDFFTATKQEVCRTPGMDNACHYDCSPGVNETPHCPVGWGCNADFICRPPTAQFETSSALDVGAWNLTAGNFDGDARGDIMSSEPLDSIGGTQLRFYYFDENGALADTRPFPKLLLSPTVKDVSGDGLSDVTFAYGGVSVMLGRSDRSWVPETFASYRVPNASVRMINVYAHRIEQASPIVPLVDLPTTSGFFIANADGQLDARATIAGRVADLVGDPVSGKLFEDPVSSPCLQPVYALRGARHFTVLNTCRTDPALGVVWRKPFESTDVTLEPPAVIDAAPLIVDMNRDGHLDVLISAGGNLYVAYGDGQKLAPAAPYQLALANPEQVSAQIPMPLAAGDFSGDGLPDFVFPDHLLVSGPAPNGALPLYSSDQRSLLGAPYTSAIIADFNGNGFPDVVAASSGSLNLEFFNGSGTPDVTESMIPTARSVQLLTAGDFDGDLVTDVGLFETPPAGESESPLRIAFGSPFAPPSPPVTVAQVAQPQQLMSYTEESLGSMIVASRLTVNGVPNGAFTFLDGSGDRQPFAAMSLTDFSATGSIENSITLGVVAGNFSSADHSDLFGLAFSQSLAQQTNSSPTQTWLVPHILGEGAVSQRLPTDLDASLSPTVFAERTPTSDMSGTSADLNGDGYDEAIFAMPAGAHQEQCGIVVFTRAHSGVTPVLPRDPILLDQPCAHPQLLAVDLDADQHLDLALLTGEAGAAARHLYVLWNDGSGSFDPAAATLVSDAQDSPQAFAVLPPSAPGHEPFRPLSLAYVTSTEVRFVALGDGPRTFGQAVSVPNAALAGGTGIATADVNGDGVTDVVVAESGKLIVLKAQLEAL